MFKKSVKTLYGAICTVLIVQLTGCGTLLYPERKGQRSGRIDIGVALLNGLGLLFFFVPGIIAFAVDFSNGTIYLPGTSRGSLDLEDFEQIAFDPRNTTMADIERLIEERTGTAVKLQQPDMTVLELVSTDEMISRFEDVGSGTHERIAFIR